MSSLPASQGEFELGEEYLPNQELNLMGKMRTLLRDPNAGFLPTTHNEKNNALAQLDYLERPGKIAHQLEEIRRHEENRVGFKTPAGLAAGRRALFSIAFEYGDYLANATNQIPKLQDLWKGIRDCPNPNVTLTEEFGSEHPGFAPLVRYFDLSQIPKKGHVAGITYDPLHTRPNRQKADEEYRNKTVEDQYTADETDPAVAARIAHISETLTIGSARQLIEDALNDQNKRKLFWTARLRETRLHGAARPIADRVLNNLGIALREKK